MIVQKNQTVAPPELSSVHISTHPYRVPNLSRLEPGAHRSYDSNSSDQKHIPRVSPAVHQVTNPGAKSNAHVGEIAKERPQNPSRSIPHAFLFDRDLPLRTKTVPEQIKETLADAIDDERLNQGPKKDEHCAGQSCILSTATDSSFTAKLISNPSSPLRAQKKNTSNSHPCPDQGVLQTLQCPAASKANESHPNALKVPRLNVAPRLVCSSLGRGGPSSLPQMQSPLRNALQTRSFAATKPFQGMARAKDQAENAQMLTNISLDPSRPVLHEKKTSAGHLVNHGSEDSRTEHPSHLPGAPQLEKKVFYDAQVQSLPVSVESSPQRTAFAIDSPPLKSEVHSVHTKDDVANPYSQQLVGMQKLPLFQGLYSKITHYSASDYPSMLANACPEMQIKQANLAHEMAPQRATADQCEPDIRENANLSKPVGPHNVNLVEAGHVKQCPLQVSGVANHCHILGQSMGQFTTRPQGHFTETKISSEESVISAESSRDLLELNANHGDRERKDPKSLSAPSVVIMCHVPATGAALLHKTSPIKNPKRQSLIRRKAPKAPCTGFPQDDPRVGGHYYRHLARFHEAEKIMVERYRNQLEHSRSSTSSEEEPLLSARNELNFRLESHNKPPSSQVKTESNVSHSQISFNGRLERKVLCQLNIIPVSQLLSSEVPQQEQCAQKTTNEEASDVSTVQPTHCAPEVYTDAFGPRELTSNRISDLIEFAKRESVLRKRSIANSSEKNDAAEGVPQRKKPRQAPVAMSTSTRLEADQVSQHPESRKSLLELTAEHTQAPAQNQMKLDEPSRKIAQGPLYRVSIYPQKVSENKDDSCKTDPAPADAVSEEEIHLKPFQETLKDRVQTLSTQAFGFEPEPRLKTKLCSWIWDIVTSEEFSKATQAEYVQQKRRIAEIVVAKRLPPNLHREEPKKTPSLGFCVESFLRNVISYAGSVHLVLKRAASRHIADMDGSEINASCKRQEFRILSAFISEVVRMWSEGIGQKLPSGYQVSQGSKLKQFEHTNRDSKKIGRLVSSALESFNRVDVLCKTLRLHYNQQPSPSSFHSSEGMSLSQRANELSTLIFSPEVFSLTSGLSSIDQTLDHIRSALDVRVKRQKHIWNRRQIYLKSRLLDYKVKQWATALAWLSLKRYQKSGAPRRDSIALCLLRQNDLVGSQPRVKLSSYCPNCCMPRRHHRTSLGRLRRSSFASTTSVPDDPSSSPTEPSCHYCGYQIMPTYPASSGRRRSSLTSCYSQSYGKFTPDRSDALSEISEHKSSHRKRGTELLIEGLEDPERTATMESIVELITKQIDPESAEISTAAQVVIPSKKSKSVEMSESEAENQRPLHHRHRESHLALMNSSSTQILRRSYLPDPATTQKIRRKTTAYTSRLKSRPSKAEV